MNPLTNVKNITKLNEIELAKGTTNKKSWHDMYKDSAWIFIGGLAYGLTEGDILAVFSQYGEIVNINLVRDKKTGKTKGFCFLCYANQKSTRLAVDNFNGIKLCSRTIRVDHVSNYKPPKEDEKDDELTKMLKHEGCAPKVIETHKRTVTGSKTKKKKYNKEKKHKKKKRKHHSDENDSENEGLEPKKVKIKKEKQDPGYDKYDLTNKASSSTRLQSPDIRFLGEGSSFQADVTSKADKYHLKNEQISRNTTHRSNSMDKEIFMPKDKRNESFLYKSHHKSAGNINMGTRKHESSRSVSSPDSSSSSSEGNVRSLNEIEKSKNNQRHRDSSNHPPYDIGRHKDHTEEKYQNYDKNISHHRGKDKYDRRREDSNDNAPSMRSSHHYRTNSHSDQKSNYIHRNEESRDKYSSDSHYSKSKYEKR